MPAAPSTHHIVRIDLAHRRQTERERQSASADRRGTAHERGYDSRWQRTRLGFLRKHPLCCGCEANGRITPATLVDHVVPHKGDMALFWERANWQPLCGWCHAHVKQVLERRYMLGDADVADLYMSRPMPDLYVSAL